MALTFNGETRSAADLIGGADQAVSRYPFDPSLRHDASQVRLLIAHAMSQASK
jgi:hypothetical protein